jgi:hypothetical protein
MLWRKTSGREIALEEDEETVKQLRRIVDFLQYKAGVCENTAGKRPECRKVYAHMADCAPDPIVSSEVRRDAGQRLENNDPTNCRGAVRL